RRIGRGPSRSRAAGRRRDGEARDGRLRSHRARAQGPRQRDRQGPRGDRRQGRALGRGEGRLRLMTARRRLVKVPASSANLGPGYDVLAAALTLHLELEVEETGAFAVEADGLEVPLDRSNLCVRSFEALRPADGITFRIRSEIPLAAGLGSSAAA